MGDFSVAFRPVRRSLSSKSREATSKVLMLAVYLFFILRKGGIKHKKKSALLIVEEELGLVNGRTISYQEQRKQMVHLGDYHILFESKLGN